MKRLLRSFQLVSATGQGQTVCVRTTGSTSKWLRVFFVSLPRGLSSPGHEFSAAPHTRCSETVPASGTQSHSRLSCQQQLRSGPPAHNSGLARFAAFHLCGHHTEVTCLRACLAPAADGQLPREAPSAPLPLSSARRPGRPSSVFIHCLS